MLVSYRLSTSFVYHVFKLLLKATMIGGTIDIIQAIEKRISCRAFTDQQVEQEKFDALVEEATRINEETGLHFQILPMDEMADQVLFSLQAAGNRIRTEIGRAHV